jgi:hypothetical protein
MMTSLVPSIVHRLQLCQKFMVCGFLLETQLRTDHIHMVNCLTRMFLVSQ